MFFFSNFVGISREKHSHPSQLSRSKDLGPIVNEMMFGKPPVQALNRRMHRMAVPILLYLLLMPNDLLLTPTDDQNFFSEPK